MGLNIEDGMKTLEKLAREQNPTASRLPETFASQRDHMRKRTALVKRDVDDMIQKMTDAQEKANPEVKRRVSYLDESTTSIRNQIDQLWATNTVSQTADGSAEEAETYDV